MHRVWEPQLRQRTVGEWFDWLEELHTVRRSKRREPEESSAGALLCATSTLTASALVL